MKKYKYTVDYYITKNITEKDKILETYDIDSKFKMTAILLSEDMGKHTNFLIPKRDFPMDKNPSKFDLLFFVEKKRFYYAVDVVDFIDFYNFEVESLESKK